MNIQWITIKTAHYEESKAFYTDRLGMTPVNEFSPSEGITICFLQADNGMQIELLSDPAVTASREASGVSIGMQTDRYDALLAHAKEDELLHSGPMVLGGSLECFFMKDPGGVLLQLFK